MYAKLLSNLETLKLEKMYSYIPNYLDTVEKEETPVLDALVHLTDKEIEYKNEMASHYNKYKLLIIDGIGYLPIDHLRANLFF